MNLVRSKQEDIYDSKLKAHRAEIANTVANESEEEAAEAANPPKKEILSVVTFSATRWIGAMRVLFIFVRV